jgi:hypothetical protein
LAAQVTRLKATIQTLRDEVSGERHAVAALERDTKKFESESEFMSLEDDVSEQREQGVQLMQSKKVCR